MSTATTPLIDSAEVERVLSIFLPAGQVTELRLLDAEVNGDRWAGTYTGYFDNAHDVLTALDTVRSAKGIYFVPNVVNPALIARASNRIRRGGDSTKDHDIIRRRLLLIDCDPVKPDGISATDAEHKAALQRVQAIRDELHFSFGWPDPVVADSGNGGHLLYRIDEPVEDNGLIAKCLKALASKFTDDVVTVDTGVFNPARIWKLYGTRAGKGDSISDRPHRMSRILSVPDGIHVVSHEQLESLASEAPAESPKYETNGHASNGMPFDIDAFISRHNFDVHGAESYQGGRKWTFKRSPMCDHDDDGPFLIQWASGALVAGCHHESCNWDWRALREKFDPKHERQKSSSHNPFRHDDEPRKEITYQRITSAELDSGDYSIEFAIEGALVLGQPLEIGGPMKVLKTSILIDAAVSLASGGCFLGRLKVNREYRTLVMSGESGLGAIQETARRVSKSRGKELKDLTNLIWSPDLPKFASMDHLDALEQLLRDNGTEVLFIDPAYLAMPSADAGNLMAQGELLRNVGEVCQRMGVTLVLCHHTKRNTGQDAYEPLELQHLAWAGHAEFARQWWLVNRREKYQPGTGDHRLWLSIGGSAGHSSLWAVDVHEGTLADPDGRRWDVSMTDAAGARDAAKERQQQAKEQTTAERLEADRKAICNALAALPDQTETKTNIRTAAGMNPPRFDPAFGSLIRDKMLVAIKVKKGNGRDYDAYTFPRE
jgi:hypothetical protein